MTTFDTKHPTTGDRIHVEAHYRPPVQHRDCFYEDEPEVIELEDVTVGRVSILASLTETEALEAEVRTQWKEAGL